MGTLGDAIAENVGGAFEEFGCLDSEPAVSPGVPGCSDNNYKLSNPLLKGDDR
jgi:hypothetical protein